MSSIPLVRKPPEIDVLFDVLVGAGVAFVVTGSVAAMLHGAQLDPGDLDITPSMDRDNLLKLSEVLLRIEAMPQFFGYWSTDDEGEKKWIEIEGTPELRANWAPDVDDHTTLDNLYFTRHGDLDVVPKLTGTFEDLKISAHAVSYGNHEILIASIDALLNGMTKKGEPRRDKDRSRVRQLKHLRICE